MDSVSKIEKQTSIETYNLDGYSVYFDKSQSDPKDPKNIVPALKKGIISDLQINQNNITHNGESGLTESIRFEYGENKTPIYIFDKHNLTFFAWCEALKENKIHAGAVLLHFDDHDDSVIPSQNNIDIHNLNEVASYTKKLNINEFISPAIKSGLVNSEVLWIAPYSTSNSDRFSSVIDNKNVSLRKVGIDSEIIKNFVSGQTDSRNLIVDIDLDYFEGIDDVPPYIRGFKTNEERFDHDIQILKELINKAGVVTISTSPTFINQEKAISIARLLLTSANVSPEF